MVLKKIYLLFLCWILIGNVVSAVPFSIGTDVEYNNGYVTVKSNGIAVFQSLSIGTNYVQVDQINISTTPLNGEMVFNITYINEKGNNRTKGERLLEYNVTYSGSSKVFTFTGNSSNDNMLYSLNVDNIRKKTGVGPFAFSYKQSSWSTHMFTLLCDGYKPDPPYNGSSHYDIPSNTVNLSWQRGNYSDQDVLVGSTSYTSNPNSGTVWQNSTAFTWYNFSVNESQSFSVFSFNSSTSTFSTPLFLRWGVLAMNCYNESNTSQNLTFDVLITNNDLSETYEELGCVNTKYVDILDIPFGDDTVFQVSSSGYETRTYTYDMVVNNFYVKDFYLPKALPPGGTTDPVYDPVNETYAVLFLLSVTNQYSQPVGGAKIEIQRHIDGEWKDVGVYLTSSAGTTEVYLYPGETYAFTISKSGYVTEIEPSIVFSEDVLVHSFQLNYIVPPPPIVITGYDIFTFDAYYLTGDNNTMYVEFVDTTGNNTDAKVFIYQNGTLLVYLYNVTTGIGENFTWLLGDHGVHNYTVRLEVYNHSDLNVSVFVWEIIIPRFMTSDESQFKKSESIEDNFVAVIGKNIFGWVAMIVLFLSIYILSTLGRSWIGVGIAGIGGVLFLFQAVFGLPNFTIVQLSVIPFFILYGFLVQISKSKKEANM